MKKALKKILLTLVVGATVIGLAACGGNESNNKPSDNAENKNEAVSTEEGNKGLEKIKEKGTLVVGLSADYAPYEFHKIIDGKDQIVGFDVEIGKAIAEALGVDIEIKDMEFGSLIGSLQAGKLDMVISGLSPDEERKKSVDFSDIYYEATHGVLVKAENKDKYKTLDDLAGKKVGAQMGSIQAELAKAQIKDADLKLLGDVNNLILELKSGKIDALVVEIPVAETVVTTNTDLVVAEPEIVDNEGGSAIAVAKGENDLLEAVNKTIKELKESGKLDKFIEEAEALAKDE